jgi:uncharacterized protein
MESADRQLLEAARTFARESMEGVPPSHGWDHVERVVRLCRHIVPTEKEADPFVLELAALLHDIARRDEDTSGGEICHAREGARRAESFLVHAGCDHSRAVKVRTAIATHRYRAGEPPAGPEGRILYDADKLDAIGAVGLGRAFLFAGEVGAKLHDPNVSIETTKPYTIDDTAYREYRVKLQHIHTRMLTTEGRRLAEDRHRFMEDFFKRLNLEVAGEY